MLQFDVHIFSNKVHGEYINIFYVYLATNDTPATPSGNFLTKSA